jgi:DNA-binding XRE family transcriptional regulator/quercetin dioxygenase-like cupin family protein
VPDAWHPGTELGPRLRRVREERQLSVRELARRVSCSASLISQIERGLSAPSVGVLYALATELRASLDFLFGVTPAVVTDGSAAPGSGAAGSVTAGRMASGPVPSGSWLPGLAAPEHSMPTDGGSPSVAAGDGRAGPRLAGHGIVQRATSRRAIDLASGVRWERLTPAADGRVDFLEVIYEPGGHSTDARRRLRHDGYEYGLITSGSLQANVGFESYELGPGDSIAFDSAAPHEYWNISAAEVHAVWVVVHTEPGRA